MSELRYDDFADAPGARRYDGYLALLCPFHDDHKPSLFVWPDGWFKCMSCGERGRWQKLHDKLNGFIARPSIFRSSATPTLNGIVEDVAEGAHRTLQMFPVFNAYLKRRGVEGMIDKCMLGWYEGWYTIPAWDEDNKFAGMAMRASTAVEEASGMRHFIPPGQPALLYVPLRREFEKAERIYIVFGIFDALVMAAAGYPVCTVIGGHRAFNAGLVEHIRKPIIVVPDHGEEGQAVLLRNKLGWRGRHHFVDWPDGCKDPNDLVMNGYKLERYIP
jgi:DNA primase